MDVYHMKRFMLFCTLLSLSFGVFSSSNFDRRLPNGADIEIGESVFKQKIVCENCEFQTDTFGRNDAKKLISRLARNGDLGSQLSYLERVSLQFYIGRTYRLGM